jgi:hypothetical protein
VILLFLSFFVLYIYYILVIKTETKLYLIKMENYTKLKDLVASIEADAEKFFNNGNSAAGTRVRKGLQEIKTLAQDIRNEITAKKNEGK